MYQVRCHFKVDKSGKSTSKQVNMEYLKVMHQTEISLKEYDVAIKVESCLFKRKISSYLVNELFKDDEENNIGVGNTGIGIITDLGSNVFDIQIGSTVVFILPETAKQSGLAHSCIVPRYFCFECHSLLDKTDVSVMVNALIPAYYTLQNKVNRGDVILICDAHTPQGQLIVQLLHKKGCKIVAYLSQEFEKDMLGPYRHMIDSFFEGWIHQSNVKQISESLIKESDCLGYSSILCLHSSYPLYDGNDSGLLPKGSLQLSVAVAILAAGGNLVLANERHTINKIMCSHLFAKGCSVHYINPTASLCSPSKLGSLFNFLISKLEMLGKKELTPPQPIHKLPIDDSVNLLNNEQDPMYGSYVVEF